MFVLAETTFFQCNLQQNQRKSKTKNKKRCKRHVDIKSAVMNTKKKEKTNKAVSYKEFVKKK